MKNRNILGVFVGFFLWAFSAFSNAADCNGSYNILLSANLGQGKSLSQPLMAGVRPPDSAFQVVGLFHFLKTFTRDFHVAVFDGKRNIMLESPDFIVPIYSGSKIAFSHDAVDGGNPADEDVSGCFIPYPSEFYTVVPKP